MTDLVAFLRARYDELERLCDLVEDPDYSGQRPMFELDPEWARRQIAANRKILAGCDEDCSDYEFHRRTCIMPALAAVYSDHPDYDPAWA